ncbi:SpaA isopeptide-forming pilin-related protein [Paenibacillus sp. IHBB 10380]|uniref:SpaA isopeptide-forming pilin-related protein n=1 Tax=Paenibacillus sp. IHBB 10380 TaxID=1566358 RepID=UPI0005CFEC3E|nr:SpaA isopeptide-forming pilin-related protein [Paenibacillus sp. IHBB 10380]AJS61223.1 hypothetical protein UB51_25410 [Paenibacillus sp. IHBB 10380]
MTVVDHTIMVQLSSTTPNKTFVFANEAVNSNVQFTKQNELAGPLQGAQFGLYPRGASASYTPLATATSTSTGAVSFTNVDYGSYDIRGISAPTGYRTFTREEMIVMLMRLVQAEALPSQQQVDFKDWKDVGGFAEEAVQEAAKAGIISGYQGRLRPKGEASRAETSVMLLHLLELETRIQSILDKQ